MQVIQDRPQFTLQTAVATTRVALINMPFVFADRPSIQCGLLKAALTRAGHEVDVYYLNLELAAKTGPDFYHEVTQLRSDLLLGDWLFSAAAFGRRDIEDAYRDACPDLELMCEKLDMNFAGLCELRNHVFPSWIRDCAARTDWSKYRVVGFTSTFEQNCASFALAHAIKATHPGVTTVFGGANFDAGMGKEYVRALPFIDFAVAGEGDVVFPAMVARLAEGRSPEGIPGVIARANGSVSSAPPAPLIEDLDLLPDPDYDEYFETLFRLGTARVLGARKPLLLFESARGCWWGEKQHCTFCGLNNNAMKFRAKSARELLEQFRRLSTRYKIMDFQAVDNIIDHRYLDELCTPLSRSHYDFRIFYETKANVTPAQLRAMARSGIRSIQPGIESLSTHILSLMRKGITMLHNVRCLKWAYYYGMRINWNVLTGFPGETRDDYEQQARVVRLLRHLPPPAFIGRIWLERFSPYFFDRTFPVRNVRPHNTYRFIYPEDALDLKEVAYFFDYEMRDTVSEDGQRDFFDEVEDWKKAWGTKPQPALEYLRAPEWIQVIDRRSADVGVHAFSCGDAEAYEFCGESDRSVRSVYQHLRDVKRIETDEAKVKEALLSFCDRGLMLEEKGRFLSLALPANPHW